MSEFRKAKPDAVENRGEKIEFKIFWMHEEDIPREKVIGTNQSSRMAVVWHPLRFDRREFLGIDESAL
jgi:hypothetical protein